MFGTLDLHNSFNNLKILDGLKLFDSLEMLDNSFKVLNNGFDVLDNHLKVRDNGLQVYDQLFLNGLANLLGIELLEL